MLLILIYLNYGKNIEFGDKKTIFIGSLIGIGVAFGIESLHRQALISRNIYKITAEPLFHVSIALIVIVIVLAPLRGEILKSWLRLAAYWIPLQILVVVSIVIGERGVAGGGFFNAPMGEPISIFLSGLFLVISIFLIITKYITLQKNA
ncbi:MAG: hypothetical protein UU88_C0003G0049 [Parcubacteria group bacterium GW2011_GWC1_42_11]|uniref:Uncharacterized protein n=1 Tax=Candidatus Nomurabacteria bacterium GW2011_GWC2_42_20 TaxID=1618756 RepID=A0A0G0ZI77_9BACT|nr:MAG: hypothetical protein UU88_C0003G0049 [Parcubacteria group bacterium GW2011_GWC1_42_11]KKS48384.1 MAG: hypothetical protein UV12_C0001G0079 [Candidatus Nomurabacteria bacterium GW2011_GWC2_42_20]KKS59457.1 MAG: hypothetical protein UV24_C0001G0045 [Candidatus Nomurabacteria bacterium GW2011_GWA2_42_41]KKT09960.1 MAG: hypothetical protein UV86_C0001G0062 [Candidatus Nomurabacteria bacterium GW2011_GWB1_43_20]TAN36059.1 MAG: hypothetical protein EPN27_02560 [Patescibacteria group bacterium